MNTHAAGGEGPDDAASRRGVRRSSASPKPGDLENDLERNYADDVVVLCELGALKGCAAIRRSARRLGLQLPDAGFQFPIKLVQGEHVVLVWKARSQLFQVEDGANSFAFATGASSCRPSSTGSRGVAWDTRGETTGAYDYLNAGVKRRSFRRRVLWRSRGQDPTSGIGLITELWSDRPAWRRLAMSGCSETDSIRLQSTGS
jgi:hypothetical protein